MLKHKLFKPDAWSPPDLSKKDDLPLEVNCNQSIESGPSYTPDKEIVIKNIMTTPVAKRKKVDPAECENKNHCEPLPDPETSEPSTSKNDNDETKSESDASCFSENEFESVHTKYYPNNHKLPYSYEEDEMILKFVLKEQNIFRTSSLSLWKYLEAKKVKPKRTYQSLKNRFMRNIKPHLFTSFKHLIDSKDTVEKILIKFPELRMEHKNKKFLSNFEEFKIEENPFEEVVMLNSDLNDCEIKTTKEEVPLTAFPEGKSENFIQSSFDPSKTPEIERIVRLHKNVIQVSIHYPKPEVPFPTVLRLTERFEKLKENNRRFPCPTCGSSFRPVPNSSSDSQSSEESDIPNSVPTETGQNNGSISNINSSRKMSLRSWSSRKNSDRQNLLPSLEKSDKLDGNSEESNSLPEEVTEKDVIEDIVEVLESPIMDLKTEKEDRTTENDADIDLIYENTVERFQELIDADEEKTSQSKCSNKDSDSIGFDDNPDKNLDSFFLETPLELEIPTVTPQVEVSSTRTRSQRVTRSSTLASNMLKMMTDKTGNRRRLRK